MQHARGVPAVEGLQGSAVDFRAAAHALRHIDAAMLLPWIVLRRSSR
jgi:hypothetical protein